MGEIEHKDADKGSYQEVDVITLNSQYKQADKQYR